MRSTGNRLFHAVSFEIIGIVLVIPLGALALGLHVQQIGGLVVGLATLAAAWNYVFNLGFDKTLRRWRGSVHKTPALRIAHALLFEAGLLVVSVPAIALSLGIGLIEALLMDAGFILFYLVYAFVFNWAWDRIFPATLPGEA